MQGLDWFFKGTASDKPLSPPSSSRENSSSSKTVTNNLDELVSISESVLNAEIYWILKVVEGHFSYRSCTDISSLIRVMIGEDIADEI